MDEVEYATRWVKYLEQAKASGRAQSLPPEMLAQIDSHIAALQTWLADPTKTAPWLS